MIHDLFQSCLTKKYLKIKFSVLCLSNIEKNVTSTHKCLKGVDTKDESELFRVTKALYQGMEV